MKRGWDRVVKEDVGVDDYTPEAVMSAFTALYDYWAEHEDELWEE